jgi:hypothetical protein
MKTPHLYVTPSTGSTPFMPVRLLSGSVGRTGPLVQLLQEFLDIFFESFLDSFLEFLLDAHLLASFCLGSKYC